MDNRVHRFKKRVLYFIENEIWKSIDAGDWVAVRAHLQHLFERLQENGDVLDRRCLQQIMQKLYLKAGEHPDYAAGKAHSIIDEFLEPGQPGNWLSQYRVDHKSYMRADWR